MVLIAQNRRLDMRDVLSHPLGPLPWSLANGDGTMKKTNKSALAKHLETKVSFADGTPTQSAALLDAMAIIQKIHGENHTFDELSDQVFAQMLHAGQGCNRFDVVFDVYREQSIKSAERLNRGSTEGIIFTQIREGHKLKNWRRLLACTESKNNLTRFLAQSWKELRRREQLGNKTMFVTHGSMCIQLTSEGWQNVTRLESFHEEADTRLLLHANHASEEYQDLVLVTDDTDVLVICLALSTKINSRIIIRRGTKARLRLVDITKLAEALGSEACAALLGLHAWTGCDSLSALAGHGKLRALKLLLRDETFRKAFGDLGTEWHLSPEVFKIIQSFTCQLYCSNTTVNKVNELRYQTFRGRGGDVESGQLPPCKDALFQHTLHVNYQSAVWRRSLENSPDLPDPSAGHGLEINETGNLAIKWMTGLPAPEVVLGLMSCRCSRTCRPRECTCILNGLKCTSACKLSPCSNMDDNDEEIHQDAEDSSDEDN